jgi:hypothetical protein
MRINSHLIDTSDLLTVLVEKIETTYPDDICLLICYGSYVTGDHGRMSDIDFFFVPKTNTGYQLGHQFILNNIGYDLWPVSWERLTRISNLEEPIASILMDGEVLFAASDDDLLKLDDLKKKLQQNLSNEAFARKMSTRYMDRAKALYWDMQNLEGDAIFVDAVQIAETLLFAIAIMSGLYTKKGLKRIDDELSRFSVKPVTFLEIYRKLIRTEHKAAVQHLTNELIAETEKIWKTRFEGDTQNADACDLAGFYEEFKSTYNKLLLACDEQKYENAYYAGFMIDRETQSFLNRYAGTGIFPGMIHEVIKNDYESLRANCIEHEQQLIQLLHQNGIELNVYSNMDEFRRSFLETTS